MPRTADHDARRRQLAEAVQSLITEDGLDRVTVARVAARAGISVGLVQHYFATKDELLLHTYQHVTQAWRARVDARIADADRRQQPIRSLLFEACQESLPLDPPRRAEYRVSQAFQGRALDNPALAEVARGAAVAIRSEVAIAVSNGKRCGEVEPTVDAEAAALGLLATLDGLAARLYHEPAVRVGEQPLPVVTAAILSRQLGETFTGKCHHYLGLIMDLGT